MLPDYTQVLQVRAVDFFPGEIGQQFFASASRQQVLERVQMLSCLTSEPKPSLSGVLSHVLGELSSRAWLI